MSKTTKTYYSEDYCPMKNRKVNKAGKQAIKDCKEYGRNTRGWGSRKKREAYNKKRLQEYYDISWDYSLDLYTYRYIANSQFETGKGQASISATVDEEGNITKYDIGNTERGWNAIKDEAYKSYLVFHKDCIENKEIVLENILKEIEKRTPLILNLLKEKPRTRGIPAKVRYKVYMRDDGKCVFCGSNINIEFDHIIPFSKGGAHTTDNIRVLCQDCNRKRGNNIEKF